MKYTRKSVGFTLIEIVVVIAIMGVLTLIVYSSFDASKAQSRDQKRISDISAIQLALEQYFNKNGVYPVSLDILKPTYISDIPTDLINNYFPLTKSSDHDVKKCISYQLWTTFERSNQYLDSKKGFDSVDSLPNNYFECGSGHHQMNASLNENKLVYDVMP